MTKEIDELIAVGIVGFLDSLDTGQQSERTGGNLADISRESKSSKDPKIMLSSSRREFFSSAKLSRCMNSAPIEVPLAITGRARSQVTE